MAASDERRRRLAWIIALVILTAAAIVLGAHPRRGIDLRVYLTAAQRFLEGTSLYRASDGAMPFKYAPPSAAFFLPLLVFPPRLATVLWNLVSVAAFGWTLRQVLRSLPAAPAFTPVFVVLALAHPLYLELHYGQVDLVMLAVLWFAISESNEQRPIRSGFAIALASLFKPPALIVLGLFLVRRQWKGLAAFAAALTVLWIPFVLRFGVSGTFSELHAWSALVERTTAPWALGYNPQGLPTALLSLFFPTDAVPSATAMMAAQLAAVGLFAFGLFVLRPVGSSLSAALVLAVALLSPLGWRANYVLAIPAVTLAIASPHRVGRGLAVLVGLCGMVVEPMLLGEGHFRDVMADARPFAVVFVLVTVWCLWQGRPQPQSEVGVVPEVRY